MSPRWTVEGLGWRGTVCDRSEDKSGLLAYGYVEMQVADAGYLDTAKSWQRRERVEVELKQLGLEDGFT